MKNLKGLKWSQITEKQQEELMSTASAIDGVSGNTPKKSGECIIDFECGLSTTGVITINEDEDTLTVDDNSILYDSEEGVLNE